MSRFNVNDSRKFANLIHQSGNFHDKQTEKRCLNLAPIQYIALAEGWLNFKAAFHVHIRARLVGESVPDELCWFFQREGHIAVPLFKQDSFGIPPDNIIDIFGKRYLNIQGSVLIKVGQSSKNVENTIVRWNSVVGLRPLNDCPRIPINLYPMKGAALRMFLSEFDFMQEPVSIIVERKLTRATWFMSIPKNKLPNKMVEGAPGIMKHISSNNSEANIELWKRVGRYNIPEAITVYVESEGIGVLFNPANHFITESVEVLVGPIEFGLNASKVSDSISHMLYYPQGDNHGEKDVENSERTRDTRAHKGRVRTQSKKGGQTRQVTASKSSGVESQTSLLLPLTPPAN